MKKFFLLCFVLLWTPFAVGCGNHSADDAEGTINSMDDTATSETVTLSEAESAEFIESYCYVICVRTNGLIVSVNDVGYIYVHCSDAKDRFKRYNTVVVEYAPDDLEEKRGFYMDDGGEIGQYSFKIKNPRGVRLADPSRGEPVFG